MKEQKFNKEQNSALRKTNVSHSYLCGCGHIHDRDFAGFAKVHGKSQDEVIEDMVNSDWSQGMDKQGNYEYWES